MENLNLFLLRIILASIVIGVVTAKKTKESHIAAQKERSHLEIANDNREFYTKPALDISKHHLKTKHKSKNKKWKRDAYGNYGASKWARRSSNSYGEYSNNLPLYLIYNRKIGAYYPFYKYPKESLRRSGSIRRVPSQ